MISKIFQHPFALAPLVANLRERMLQGTNVVLIRTVCGATP
jgi:hypothetical protein